MSIGSGYGDAELKIIKKLSEKTTLTIDLLECYERGNDQFSHLSTIDFGKNVKNVQTLQEDFNANTQLLEESYDIITMFHVHYYWITANDRAEIMKKVFGSLKPEGILYILMLDKVCICGQFGSYRAYKKVISKHVTQFTFSTILRKFLYCICASGVTFFKSYIALEPNFEFIGR